MNTSGVKQLRDTSLQDRPIQADLRHSRRRRAWIAACVSAVLILVLMVRGWHGDEIVVSRDSVQTAKVARGVFTRDISAQGNVVAAVSPTLFAPAEGTVSLLVRAGDVVEKGQALATVDSPSLRNELAREQATLAGLELAVERQSIETRESLLTARQASDLAKASMRAAGREFHRAEMAWQKGVISQRDFDEARDATDAATINSTHAIDAATLQDESHRVELRARMLERDRQRLVVNDLARRVGALNIRSPVDGVVGSLIAADQSAVSQNAPLLSTVDLRAFEIEISIPETLVADLILGMAAEVNFASHTYAASLSAISPEVRQGQVTGRLRFSKEIPGGLRQNQRVSTRIVIDSRPDVMQVARGSFLETDGGRIAYVIRGDKALRSDIRTGAASVSAVEIVSGLKPGDEIIVSPISQFEGAAAVLLTN